MPDRMSAIFFVCYGNSLDFRPCFMGECLLIFEKISVPSVVNFLII